MKPLALCAFAALVVAAAPALAQDAPSPVRSAIVIVVENNDSIARGGKDRLLRFLDAVGEPAYAKALERTARKHWDKVVTLIDAKATFEHFKGTLAKLDEEGFTIDVVLDIHGSSSVTVLGNGAIAGPDRLHFAGRPVTVEEVAALGKPRALRLNAVYMVACWGSRFNQAWLDAGARAANGARELNYYVLLSPVVFLGEWGRGADMASAAEKAFLAERALLDRKTLDRALAPRYGARGVDRIQSAASSARIHAGGQGFAACRREKPAPKPAVTQTVGAPRELALY
jgi:hypothetical protein